MDAASSEGALPEALPPSLEDFSAADSQSPSGTALPVHSTTLPLRLTPVDPASEQRAQPRVGAEANSCILKLKGLPYSCTESDIKAFFGPGFDVKRIAWVAEPDGRPSGLAFAEFGTKEEALKALSKNGEFIGERYVRLLHVPRAEMEEQVRLGTLAIPGAAAKLRSRMMRAQQRNSMTYVTTGPLQIVPTTAVLSGSGAGVTMVQAGGPLGVGHGAYAIQTQLGGGASGTAQYATQAGVGPSATYTVQGIQTGGAGPSYSMQAVQGGASYSMQGAPFAVAQGGGAYSVQPSGPYSVQLAGSQLQPVETRMWQTPGYQAAFHQGAMTSRASQSAQYQALGGASQAVGPGQQVPMQRTTIIQQAPQLTQQITQLGLPAGLQRGGSSPTVKIRGLPYRSSPVDILAFFQGYHYIPDSLQIGLDQLGRPSGEAWLTFVSPQEALRSVRDLNRHYLGSRYLELSIC